MRMFIAAGALALLATPVVGQRVDTRRVDVRESGTGTTCGFRAYRELTLVDASRTGRGRVASWARPAIEDSGAILRLTFRAGTNWRSPGMMEATFTIAPGVAPVGATGPGARISIDGETPIRLEHGVSGAGRVFAIKNPDELAAFGLRLIRGRRVELVLPGSGESGPRRYSWNVAEFGDAAEVLEIAGWSCIPASQASPAGSTRD